MFVRGRIIFQAQCCFPYIMLFLHFFYCIHLIFLLLGTLCIGIHRLLSLTNLHLIERPESQVYWIILQWCQTEDNQGWQSSARATRIVVSQLLNGSMKNKSAPHHDRKQIKRQEIYVLSAWYVPGITISNKHSGLFLPLLPYPYKVHSITSIS